MTNAIVRRTNTNNPDFEALVNLLDHELWDELKEDQATYDPHNKVPDLQTAVLVYVDDEAVACGCFKIFDADSVEVKRMFVKKEYRGNDLSKLVLEELEQWAAAEDYKRAVLETSKFLIPAVTLYQSSGYTIIENYGPYRDLADSICMQKPLHRNGSEW